MALCSEDEAMKLPVAAISLVLVLAAPIPAGAQDRGFVRALGGATMGTESGAVVGGTVGVRINPKTQIFGEVGRLQNVLPSSVLDEVEIASALAANTRAGKASSTASAKATYGLVGVRMNVQKVGDAQLFVEGGGGAAQVKSRLEALIRGSETLQGDISNLVSVPFTASSPETKALATIGGGLTLAITQKVGVEMGYRYIRIFTDHPAINAGSVYGALRFGF
jgi:opacity protein-like surface antigen